MAGLASKQSPCLEEKNPMRSKRRSILASCLLIAIVLVFIFPHVHWNISIPPRHFMYVSKNNIRMPTSCN